MRWLGKLFGRLVVIGVVGALVLGAFLAFRYMWLQSTGEWSLEMQCRDSNFKYSLRPETADRLVQAPYYLRQEGHIEESEIVAAAYNKLLQANCWGDRPCVSDILEARAEIDAVAAKLSADRWQRTVAPLKRLPALARSWRPSWNGAAGKDVLLILGTAVVVFVIGRVRPTKPAPAT